MSRLITSNRWVHTALQAASLCALATLGTSAPAAGGKGLTYGVGGHDAVLGIDYVANGRHRQPIHRATRPACTRSRPVLCINVGRLGAAELRCVAPAGEYCAGWVEGHFATTKPVKGNTLDFGRPMATALVRGPGGCRLAHGGVP